MDDVKQHQNQLVPAKNNLNKKLLWQKMKYKYLKIKLFF